MVLRTVQAAELRSGDPDGEQGGWPRARKVLGWPKRWKLAHAFPWEYSCKRLKLAQLLGQPGVFLTAARSASSAPSSRATGARKVLGWPKRWQLAHAFRWEYS